jgi:hypothetical protein
MTDRVAAMVFKHQGDLRAAARDLGVPVRKLRTFMLQHKGTAAAYLELAHQALDYAEENCIKALQSGDKKKQQQAAAALIKIHGASRGL